MVLTRQLVHLGREVRKSSNIRVRQPLPRAVIGLPNGRDLSAELLAEVAGELNVREVTPLPEASDEMAFTELPGSGWAVASRHGVTIALDTTVTPELHAAGLVREVVRRVQAARKEAGFEVTDRIVLSWTASGETAVALRAHQRELADTVLASAVVEYPMTDLPVRADASDARVRRHDELGVCFWLARAATTE